MTKVDDTVKPQTGLIVCLAADYRTFSQSTLVEFYQPIMGANAFALLFALKNAVTEHPTLSSRLAHTRLLDQLGFDITELENARRRLEALGLLRTYETTDQMGTVVVYELQSTQTPKSFVNDDLLSVLLLEAIGETKFDELVKSVTKYSMDVSQLTEATKTFLDTFHVNASQITDSPSIIRESREQFVVSQPRSSHQIPAVDFDFKLLTQLLDKQPISDNEINKHQTLIRTEHVMYGIDEPQMARLIMESTDLVNNELDEQRFKKVISTNFQMQHSDESKTSKDTVAPDTQLTANTSKTDLTSNEKQLIKACETYTPNDFLQILIGKKGGFVPRSSENALRNLIERDVLSKSVINMLIYYVIQERNNTSLSQNFIDTIASGWLQAQVTTATEALTQIKEFSNRGSSTNSGEKAKRTRYVNKKSGQVRETLPDWAQEGYQHQSKKVSEDEVSKIKAQLQAMKQQQESEE